MHRISIILALVACVGHGQRVLAHQATSGESLRAVSGTGTPSPSTSLLMLLLSLNEAAGFNPSASGIRYPMANGRHGTRQIAADSQIRRGRHAPVMIDLIEKMIDQSIAKYQYADVSLKDLDRVYNDKAADVHAIPWDREMAEREVEEATNSPEAGVYSEVTPRAVVHLLSQTRTGPGKRYYDLGSGFGKTVILAALLGLNATGIELSTQHYKESCKALDWAQTHIHRFRLFEGEQSIDANFVHGNFLEQDFSDADVVFINSLTFTPELMADIGDALASLRHGAKIISAKEIPGSRFKLSHRIMVPGSMIGISVFNVQEVVDPTFEDIRDDSSFLPPPIKLPPPVPFPFPAAAGKLRPADPPSFSSLVDLNNNN